MIENKLNLGSPISKGREVQGKRGGEVGCKGKTRTQS